MKNKNYYNSTRIHDHTINCDICGTVCWFSETRELGVYTGQGGARVCKRHKDPIDYGLVPYKIPAEKPVRTTRLLNNFNNVNNISGGAVTTNWEDFNPLEVTPQILNGLNIWDQSIAIWDQASYIIWDQ